MTTWLETEARRAWLEGAAQTHYGICSGCGRHHDDAGKPLYVARRPHSRRFVCLECFDQPVERRAA